MKVFLRVMAVIFAILAIIFYANSIKTTGYGYEKVQVANVQMTVFAAAAVLCAINFVGALILSSNEAIQESISSIGNSIPTVSASKIATAVANTIGQSTIKREAEFQRKTSERDEKQYESESSGLSNHEEMTATDFLEKIKESNDMTSIWQIWNKSNLGQQYQEADKYISSYYMLERKYSRIDGDKLAEIKEKLCEIVNQ